MSREPIVRPPRIAGWLVDLVTSSEQAESIRGDLLEEFSALSLESGGVRARRWYWRQSIKTVAPLVASRLPVIAGAVAGGWLLLSLVFIYTQIAVTDVLVKHGDQVYARIDAHMFWLLYAIWIELVIEPFFIGLIVAVVAEGKELFVTVMLSATFFFKDLLLPKIIWYIWPRHQHIEVVPNLWLFFLPSRYQIALAGSWTPNFWFPNFPRMPILVITFVSPVMIVIGGVIVRKIRSVMPRHRSTSRC